MKEIINVIITPKIVKATLIPLRLFVTLAKVFPIEVYEYIYEHRAQLGLL